MLWLLPLNILLFYLTKYPRRVLNQNSFYFTFNTHLKERALTKLAKKLIIKLLKPFLVRDKANNLSLICFCNTLVILAAIDLSSSMEGLIISISAACIFHFFVVTIPTERKKIATLKTLSPIMQRFMSNDDELYLLIGYQSKDVDLTTWHPNDLQRLKAKLIQRMKEVVGGNGKYMFQVFSEPRFKSLGSGVKFNEAWSLLVSIDREFFSYIKEVDLTNFPDLFISVELFFQQYSHLTSNSGGKHNPEDYYLPYLCHRQKLIAEYINSAANYTHGHEMRFMSYKGVQM